AQAGLDASGLGIALTGFAVGLLAGTRVADPAVRRWGGRRVVRGGIPVMGVGFALLPAAGGLVSLTVLFLGIGVLAGLIDVAMNIEAVAVERRFERRVMSAIHGTWSVALFVGAALASAGIAAGLSIGIHLPISAALVVVVSAVFLRWLPDAGEPAEEPVREASAERPVEPNVGRASPAGVLLLLCLVAGASFLVEGIAVEWSAVLLRESVGADPGAAGLGVVAFSAGMAASRFTGDRLVARFGQPAVARVGTSSAFVAFGAMLIVHDLTPSLAAFGIVGLGIGPVVPLAFRTAGRIRRPGHASALPLVVTAGYAGSIVGPLIVGFIADLATLRIAFVVPLVACAVSALAAGATRDR
ncbi:MAG TPA: MFS transporter, partial [Actinomycetota bacterium]|nr:MFS transporter [Actinomycetota bacterium]